MNIITMEIKISMTKVGDVHTVLYKLYCLGLILKIIVNYQKCWQ